MNADLRWVGEDPLGGLLGAFCDFLEIGRELLIVVAARTGDLTALHARRVHRDHRFDRGLGLAREIVKWIDVTISERMVGTVSTMPGAGLRPSPASMAACNAITRPLIRGEISLPNRR